MAYSTSAQVAHMDPKVRMAELAALTRPGPIERAFRRIVLAVREMNHASHRIVEVQAPWTVDAQWHSK
jgi:hypothetical protein